MDRDSASFQGLPWTRAIGALVLAGFGLAPASAGAPSALPFAGARAEEGAPATIDVDTTAPRPIQPGFSGINDELGFPVEYWDSRFEVLAARVNYGWIRFPGGSSGDIYDWHSGAEVQAWADQFAGYTMGPRPEVVKYVAGKGGARMIDAAKRAKRLGASLIVCANAFTDTPQSVGQMAAYARANQIRVSVWELANEAYLFPRFFHGAADYLDKMRPYRDAIKAADPNAVVAIFARDPGTSDQANPWDRGLQSYPDKYWDAVTFHYYPPLSSGEFAQWMADESGVLATKSSALVTGRLASIGPPGTKFLITEFDPSIPKDPGTGAVSLTDGTLWGGIYVAEFIMRMSTVPSVAFVGPHAIWEYSGVSATNPHYTDVVSAADKGTTIDTSTLDFGFFLSAQGAGLAVLNAAINRAVVSNRTTVTGGDTVPATGAPQGHAPALFAMSYTDRAGNLSVVVTNKSARAQRALIRVNGRVINGLFQVWFVTGSDPRLSNTPANPSAVTVRSGISPVRVRVPPYSVLCLEQQHDALASVQVVVGSSPK